MILKTRNKLVAAALAAATLSSAASATCLTYYCTGVIQTMSITSTAVYIRLVGDTTGLTNCTPYSSNYFTLPKSDTNFSTYYATLLAAYMAKESVTIRPNDASPNCTVGYIQVP